MDRKGDSSRGIYKASIRTLTDSDVEISIWAITMSALEESI
jgi:hypothetical protein